MGFTRLSPSLVWSFVSHFFHAAALRHRLTPPTFLMSRVYPNIRVRYRFGKSEGKSITIGVMSDDYGGEANHVIYKMSLSSKF